MSKVIMICGEPNTGKSHSLRYLENRDKFVFLNCDNKSLPMRKEQGFAADIKVENPMDVLSYIEQVMKSQTAEGLIIDTLTKLMGQFERKLVDTSSNTLTSWKDYGNYYNNINDMISVSDKFTIVTAHTQTELNGQSGNMESKILIKGANGKLGIDSDHNLIVTTKQMPISKLRQFENPLLTITEKEERLGVKKVFCTQLTKEF